jgi:hypothetical protein
MTNHKLFVKCVNLFRDELKDKTDIELRTKLNICCDDKDERDIHKMYGLLVNSEFADLSIRNIYIVLIYIYYSLRFNEQTEDWLSLEFLNSITTDFERSKQLYLAITTGDIMVNGVNISSKIRKTVLEMDGGIKKHTRRKHKKRLKRTYRR